MTTEEFNALPLEARRFIQSQQACLSCGKKNNLDAHYKNYLNMKNQSLFTLRNGAVSFFDEKTKKSQILYPLHPNDSEDQIKEKLKIALRIHAVRPERFSVISVSDIEAKLKEKKVAKKVEKDEKVVAEKVEAEAIAEAPQEDEKESEEELLD